MSVGGHFCGVEGRHPGHAPGFGPRGPASEETRCTVERFHGRVAPSWACATVCACAALLRRPGATPRVSVVTCSGGLCPEGLQAGEESV